VLRRGLDGLGDVATLEEIEPADSLPSLGEGTVGDQELAAMPPIDRDRRPGRLCGRDAVQVYRTRQWRTIDPRRRTAMTGEASASRRKLSAILMIDVAGFSRLMGRDEEGTTALIREFHDRTQGLVQAHAGRVVDTGGDSVFGEFDSVINAVRCARAIQAAQAAANASRAPDRRIETRIGVHLGDVIVQDYRVYGDGVNIAARLQSVAAPGGICVSEAVYQQVYKKLDLAFEDLGVRELKNIEHPIRLYRVITPEGGRAAPLAQPPAPTRSPDAPARARRRVSWTDALLHPSSLAPLMIGAYLLATALGLPPAGRMFPAFGAILVGVGLGHALRRRTGRHAFFLIALGAGLILAAVAGNWRSGPPWWLVLGGVVVIVVGLTQLRSRDERPPD
jgi:class 3 adenylate cyclase